MKSSFRYVAVCLIAAFALAARAADDLKQMSGTWKPTQAEFAGQPMPPLLLKSITLKIDGPNYEVTVDRENEKSRTDKGTVTVDGATQPKGMTITGVDGPNAGKTFLAIYEFTGDTLRVCYDLSGTNRPTEFKTAPETKLYLVVYERAR